jgi:hypothetical protein
MNINNLRADQRNSEMSKVRRGAYSPSCSWNQKYEEYFNTELVTILERAYDLTEKFQGGPANSLTQAVNAAEKHMRTKTGKGYQPAPMIRG